MPENADVKIEGWHLSTFKKSYNKKYKLNAKNFFASLETIQK